MRRANPLESKTAQVIGGSHHGTDTDQSHYRLERYRQNAESCLELAQTFTDPENKRALLGMANAWLTLAEQHLKNSETTLVYETPPPRNEPPHQLMSHPSHRPKSRRRRSWTRLSRTNQRSASPVAGRTVGLRCPQAHGVAASETICDETKR